MGVAPPMEAGERRRFICFSRDGQERAFNASFSSMMADIHKNARGVFISEENVLALHHGLQWTTGHPDNRPSEVHTISAEYMIQNQDLIDNDLGIIEKCMVPVSESMQRQFSESMYGTVAAAAESIGNVVNSKEEGSISQSFLAMLKRIEFGVDRKGKISLPQIHLHPSMYDKFVNELESQNEEYKNEVERIKTGKIAEALANEERRKNKFKSL